MSETDRAHYTPEITEFSERELQRLLEVAFPPVCLLGGWAVHLHVTEAFEAERGRTYIGSRDIDLGVFVDPNWSPDTISSESVADTIANIESQLTYNRGRFGFYLYFHRTTSEPLSDEEAAGYPQHDIFRLDIDIIPSTAELDAFEEIFGFRPPAEPLLQPVFEDGRFESLQDYVEWDAPSAVKLVPRQILAAMKVRSYPRRDKSHKRRKDLADLHALIWYGIDYQEIRSTILEYLDQSDIDSFRDSLSDEELTLAAGLIGDDPEVVTNSIRQLLL